MKGCYKIEINLHGYDINMCEDKMYMRAFSAM